MEIQKELLKIMVIDLVALKQFLKIKNPTEAPDFLNPVRLTLWEATEINFDKRMIDEFLKMLE